MRRPGDANPITNLALARAIIGRRGERMGETPCRTRPANYLPPNPLRRLASAALTVTQTRPSSSSQPNERDSIGTRSV